MATLRAERATLEHARQLASCMREGDVQEVRASGDQSPFEALKFSLEKSKCACALFADDKILCIWGVVEKDGYPGVASPWILSSVHVDTFPILFYKESVRIIAGLRARYRVIVNMIDARYEKSVKFYRKLGFDISDPVPYGIFGLPFHVAKMTGGN